MRILGLAVIAVLVGGVCGRLVRKLVWVLECGQVEGRVLVCEGLCAVVDTVGLEMWYWMW